MDDSIKFRILQALLGRLKAEQSVFDPGDDQYTAYQTQIDAAQSKLDAVTQNLNQVRLQARPVHPMPPVRA